ncbi:methylenetetrahydrofolate dehydrogenase [Penicillium angulare]|uniref:methylenetetrahydrofolate dehydrogenase n=1 Tax=Penicillium angulare TaxID=116970 RepID=UPI002540D634|nr:methylenetetrahydrofolate dehydrogenase [Penicillium angulare]KAJ5290991.1 methylenetetrahydrofolate dehydrogenase [Penicillium angulare]
MSAPKDAAPASCKVMLSKHVANRLSQEVQEGVKTLEKPPHLVGFLANDDPAALMYAQMTQKTCEENGFKYSLRSVGRDDIEEAILSANTDSEVDGIIVYYPIFNNRQDQYLQQIVDVGKDVEGLSHRYIFNMYQNIRFLDPETKRQKCILPCTPLANIKILEYLNIYNTVLPHGNRLFGHTICVVNRSEVVGRPLAALLANDGACVYSVDITGIQKFTRGEGLKKHRHEVEVLKDVELKDVVPLCDVVISGVPGDKYKFDTSLLREGAVCVNFSSEKNFGPEVKEKASIFVPSIGKVTIVVLLRNLLRLIQNRRVDDIKPAAATERPGTLEASS